MQKTKNLAQPIIQRRSPENSTETQKPRTYSFKKPVQNLSEENTIPSPIYKQNRQYTYAVVVVAKLIQNLSQL